MFTFTQSDMFIFTTDYLVKFEPNNKTTGKKVYGWKIFAKRTSALNLQNLFEI